MVTFPMTLADFDVNLILFQTTFVDTWMQKA